MSLFDPKFTVCFASVALCVAGSFAAERRDDAGFHKEIRPLLETYCFDCHADGANKGNVSFDQFSTGEAVLADRELWLQVLRNLRAGLMPPQKKTQPSAEERQRIERWIKQSVFAADSQNPDPGRVTIRRLNRTEYRNTVRDLLGARFDSITVFPPDDTGHGFDNISDVLTLPPMLLEKYVLAANQIIAQVVPITPGKESGAAAKNYARFFPRPIPPEAKAKREYAEEILRDFARRAFRRPPETATVDRLVSLAEGVYAQPGVRFESGIAQAMTAVLVAPSFLFREERLIESSDARYPLVDEFSLASRLSYFLWSSMPDDELLRLAERGELRKNLSRQVERLLADEKSEAFVRNFVGQWLRARDIENVAIEARSVLAREDAPNPEAVAQRQRLRELRERRAALLEPERKELEQLVEVVRRLNRQPLRAELIPELRYAMRRETEMSFDYLLREDRSLLELLDADYTFLNADLAAHYGIPGVTGENMRRVKLPPDSPRGGVLTQGTMLGVTSNPTRTSPVKRGVFVLDNILGTPPPPPPANVPPLESATKGATNQVLSLRESLAVHRESSLCASCHNRMDPIGLAFENFNAMGMWRDQELANVIDATGQLITGESFRNVRELKRILVEKHAADFYRTVTEKMLIYALGRGLEYYDVETCDQIEARLAATQGRPSALIAGIVESAAFQKSRRPEKTSPSSTPRPQQRADARRSP